MERISSIQFQHSFDLYQHKAMQDTIVIANNGEDCLALISIEEYRRLKRREDYVMTLADYTENE